MSSRFLIRLLFLFFIFPATAQSTYLHHNQQAHHLLERYEMRTGLLRTGLYSGVGPYSREAIGALEQALDSLGLPLSAADRHNLMYLQAENLPWSQPPVARKPWLGYFYPTQASMLQINDDDFFLSVNPGLYLHTGSSDLDDNPLYTNTRALKIRGQLNQRLGFYSFISENQLRAPLHQKQFRQQYNALPGAHMVKTFKDDGLDYFTASGYVSFRLIPAIELQAGQSANFIGHGQRSLLLSDFATDYLFLKFSTRINRFYYQNLFARLTDRSRGGGIGRVLPAKYMAAHYLGIDLAPNLNLGFYEAVMFHDNDGTGRGFELHYLNPVIFYRSVEHQLGDPDKMLVGLNAAWLPARDVKLYGQLVVNEFMIEQLRSNDGWAHNKYGYQLGLKYVDVAGISNLDLGAEYNRVRPYTYTHKVVGNSESPVNSYSHYNQHLAHPLGANFSEWLFSLKAQPWPRITAGIDLITARYGADHNGSNWGQNIFLDYNTHEREHGNYVGQGIATSLLIAEAWTSYQLFHNLFLDLDLKYRKLQSELSERNSKNLFIGGGVRMNLNRGRWEY